jgi:hypothetical protein
MTTSSVARAAQDGTEGLEGVVEDPVAAGTEAPRRLELYGFADFVYFHPFMSPENPWTYLLREYPSFLVGSLNMYVDAALSSRMRSLVEVRFLYTPDGDQKEINLGGLSGFQRNISQDPADYGRTLRWGGISIERAWLEYEFHELLTVRGGHFLTPYGIWNVDHGSPVIIGIRRPFIIGNALFPERQIGIELLGSRSTGAFKFGYHLTLSNGRGPIDTVRDLDRNKGIGGRVFVQGRRAPELIVGLSGFKARYTDIFYGYTGPPLAPLRRSITIRHQWDEQSLGLDLRLHVGPLFLQSEFIVNDRRYTAAGRERVSGMEGTFLPDKRDWGGYVLAAYELPWFELRPYAMYEQSRDGMPNDRTAGLGPIPRVDVYYAGLNWRPITSVVLKLEYAYGHGPGAPIVEPEGYTLKVLQMQASWAF